MPFNRSKVIIVIDGLTTEQLTALGQAIKQLSVLPIVTLVSAVPILNEERTEVEKLQTKQKLADAKEALNISAASEKIIPGSNPRSTENFFLAEPFDAMVKRGQNGKPAISVKNFDTTGIKELTDSSSMPVVDVSNHKSLALQSSYKGIFAKSQSAEPNLKNSLTIPLDEQEQSATKLTR